MLRYKSFRFCMLVGAGALVTVAVYYFVHYAIVLDIALDNSGVRDSLQASIRALWLAFTCQALLIGVLYALVAFRPKAVSREVVALFGLLQLLEAVLLFSLAGNRWMALLLVGTAACVLVGVAIWPTNWPPPVPDPAQLPPAAAADGSESSDPVAARPDQQQPAP